MKNPPLISRRQERPEGTRARLLRAAEKIFARDGFEAARLEDIATEAGHTRGAFYANFASKEDLFLALLESEVTSRIAHIERLLGGKPHEKLRISRDSLLAICEERRWTLLVLEFKLFAVRHPEVRARLAAMNRRLAGPRVRLLEEIAQATRRRLSLSPAAAAMSLSAVTHALALEHMLDRSMLPEAALKTLLLGYFDTLTGGPHVSPSANGPSDRAHRPPARSTRR
ncbi:MAG TPA: TetR/AcrR family transcriptional regulator [Candidatus Binatia bacterium]|nr:TetR/AcrR family transcriptional regulator [Candidatus Binatia bacterium]